jgi:peptidoglycan/LPS O-acetylase OafA/YrhL
MPESRQGAGHEPSGGSDAPPGGEPPREKDASVETLRGIAIVLLVAFHAIGEFSNGGKAAGDTGFYSHFNYSLNYFRMPLFTVISGFIYSLRPATSGATLEFLQAKARRILIPFLSVTMLTWAVRTSFRNYTHYTIDGLIHMVVYGVDQLWFLQAVFLAFIAAAILDRYGMMSRFGRWLLCLIVAGSLSFALPRWKAFGFDGFLYLLPYFLLGCGIYRFPGPLRSASLIGPAALLLLAGVTSQQLVWAGRLDLNDDRISPLALSVGLSGNLLLFRFRRPLPILPVLGHYSYPIYLFHFFALAMTNRLPWFASHPNTDLLIASRLLCGLLLPIAAEFVLRRSQLLRRLFLGLR